MASVRELILAASTLPQGATHRQHLENLNAGSGVVLFFDNINVVVEDKQIFAKIDTDGITAVIEDNNLEAVLVEGNEIIIENNEVKTNID